MRVLFDNGAGGTQPGQPKPGFEHSFGSFPIPGTTARSWYLGPNGALGDSPGGRWRELVQVGRRRHADDRLQRRHRRGRRRPLDGDAALQVGPEPGGQRSLLRDRSARREHDRDRRRRRQGSGSRSSTPNVDLQATISEIRPDGKETFVQNGWVRGQRAQARHEEEHPARAGPEPARDPTSRRCRRQVRRRSRSRSTTRATPIAPARASG